MELLIALSWGALEFVWLMVQYVFWLVMFAVGGMFALALLAEIMAPFEVPL